MAQISYGFKTKKEDGTFSDEIKFATTTDLVKKDNRTLEDILKEIKENKSLFAGCSGNFTEEDGWSNQDRFRLSDTNPTQRTLWFSGNNLEDTIYLIPLNYNLTEGTYPSTGIIDPDEPLPEYNGKYFSFSKDGGIECLYSGYIEISASAYFRGVTMNNLNTYAALFIFKGSNFPNLNTGIFPVSQTEDLYEVFSGRRAVNINGTQSTGRRILKVEAGDKFYFGIMPSDPAVECYANHRNTGLNINYISIE